MGRKGEVLVAIIHDKLDFDTLRTQQWYRIPMSSQRKWLKDRWPPEIIAFYQTRNSTPKPSPYTIMLK